MATVSLRLGEVRASNLRRHALVALGALGAAVLMTWPLAVRAGSEVLAAIYYWDAFTNTMIMGGRVDAALGRGPLSLYDDYFFAPLPNTIVFNENLFGLSLIFAPFYLVSDNPLWAYNVTLLVSLALSTFFTYLLVQRLARSVGGVERAYAGFLAGVAFAFCPYVFFEIGRIQLVATQWIPACFLFLHRAIEERRLRDIVGLWVCYLLQIGTCLYYAMFLIPLLALVGGLLLWRGRPPRRFYGEFAAAGAVAVLVAMAMVYPYFTARDAFALERTLAFASGYDGKLEFFSNVHVTNRSLVSMHHTSERGAREEIAFPGFTVLALALLAVAVPLGQKLTRVRSRGGRTGLELGLVVGGAACALTLLTHSMLVGVCVVAAGVGLSRVGFRSASGGAFPPRFGTRGVYLALLCLAVLMFLGLMPLEWQGEPVRGLYYYFHSYFPGFNGIRKVSRQAVMTTFACVVLASFGTTWLFARVSAFANPVARSKLPVLSELPRLWVSGAVFGVLLAFTVYELRSFPHATVPVWAGDGMPRAYHFMASLPARDLVAGLPQYEGVQVFRGDAGRAFHNYLMLFHKHRSVNGQSSYTLPVTDLVERMLRHLPDDAARRVLASIGTRHFVVHAADLEPARRTLPEELVLRSEYFRRVFHEGSDSVFSLVPQRDPTLELLEVPPLPAHVRVLPPNTLRASANLETARARWAIDGDIRSYWSTRRIQEPGHFFEVELAREERVVAFEIDSQGHVSDVPLSFELSVSRAGSPWQTSLRRPSVRLYREQIYSPKKFVFRVVLPEPIPVDRIRISIVQPLPGHEFVVHEARVYAAAP